MTHIDRSLHLSDYLIQSYNPNEKLFPTTEQAFGSLLLLVGKVHFNYIYGIGVLGCLAMYGLLTLMSMAPVPVAVVVSVLGYCILPIVMLSAVSVVFSLQGGEGAVEFGIWL